MSKIFEIYLSDAAGRPMKKVKLAQLEAGKGMVGDRYYNEKGTFSKKLAGLPDKELTLIELEQVDSFNQQYGFNFTCGDFRRNIVTQGVNLNQLEGKLFTLGGIRLRGVRLCEPCAHLANIMVPEIMPALVHKTGLRAQIVESCIIKLGDTLAVQIDQ